ncbi:UNVERIFIED_CONTAM: hypothetical protein Scaly_2679200 [Sesamum calycinum]|uniref:PGG domain-containing protein n=1 Tax=Sesamum calycinum TaxID=2727403 RepID=A0AAW2J694_9LAMI
MKTDLDGRTALHSAVTVQYLVRLQSLNLHAENANGLKALDMLFVNVFNSNDVHIEETITLAGGSRSQMTPTNVPTRLQHPPPNNSSRSSSQAEDDQNAKHKWFTELRSGIIVMASVFATMTFQVALTPPGGMWQDWGPNAATSNSSSAVPAHKPGETILYDLYVGAIPLFKLFGLVLSVGLTVKSNFIFAPSARPTPLLHQRSRNKYHAFQDDQKFGVVNTLDLKPSDSGYTFSGASKILTCH